MKRASTNMVLPQRGCWQEPQRDEETEGEDADQGERRSDEERWGRAAAGERGGGDKDR